MKMTVFWDVAPCNLVETDGRFGGYYCLIIKTQRPDNLGINHL
jgi:hypothetical protein